MAGTASLAGGVTHGLAHLSDSERHAAQSVLAKLKHPGRGLASHFGGESATVSSGSSLSVRGTAALGASTMLSARGSDTFMGGVRSAPLSGLRVGNDTVVSGSTTKLGMHGAETNRGAQHFSLSSDTINVAGVTAAHVQTGHTAEAKGTHTVTLSDKTTIKISGLSSHDISKLHH
jgi:hypothetical protein